MQALLLQTTEMTVWDGWGSVAIVTAAMVTFMLVIAVLVWQVFRTWQSSIESRAAISREAAFQKLAEESAEAQKEIAERQSRISADLATVNERLAGIERILQQVG